MVTLSTLLRVLLGVLVGVEASEMGVALGNGAGAADGWLLGVVAHAESVMQIASVALSMTDRTVNPDFGTVPHPCPDNLREAPLLP